MFEPSAQGIRLQIVYMADVPWGHMIQVSYGEYDTVKLCRTSVQAKGIHLYPEVLYGWAKLVKKMGLFEKQRWETRQALILTSRLYRLVVSQAQKAKESAAKRPRLRASQRMPASFFFL